MGTNLSICIATFNRAAFIGETLDSIIPQITDGVELVIVDGASTDNTEEIVRRYQQQCPSLHYLRQEVNNGVDRDYNHAVELARGEYCWLMTDDDILHPGAVQAILKELKKNYGLIIVNAEVRTAGLSRVVDTRRLEMNANRIYGHSDSCRLFVDTAAYLTFIGGVVIKRQLWNQREKEKYFGSLFIHVGVIFQEPLLEDTLVIAEPYIAIRYGNAQWTPRSFEIWMFKWPWLIWSFPDFPDSAKSRVFAREPWRKLRTLLMYRASGAYTLREYQDWVQPRIESGLRKLLAKMIAVTPGWFLNLLGISYLFIIRTRAGHGRTHIELKNSPFYYRNYFSLTFRTLHR